MCNGSSVPALSLCVITVQFLACLWLVSVCNDSSVPVLKRQPACTLRLVFLSAPATAEGMGPGRGSKSRVLPGGN